VLINRIYSVSLAQAGYLFPNLLSLYEVHGRQFALMLTVLLSLISWIGFLIENAVSDSLQIFKIFRGLWNGKVRPRFQQTTGFGSSRTLSSENLNTVKNCVISYITKQIQPPTNQSSQTTPAIHSPHYDIRHLCAPNLVKD
jgi:hypothetical protein